MMRSIIELSALLVLVCALTYEFYRSFTDFISDAPGTTPRTLANLATLIATALSIAAGLFLIANLFAWSLQWNFS